MWRNNRQRNTNKHSLRQKPSSSLLSFSKRHVRISHCLALTEELPPPVKLDLVSEPSEYASKFPWVTNLLPSNLKKGAKFNTDSCPLKLCERHVTGKKKKKEKKKNIHSSSNATVQVMEVGHFRTSGSSHAHRRPRHSDTTKESAFLWQMPTSQKSITFATTTPTTATIKHYNNRNTAGLHFRQAFVSWHVYRKNIYRIQKAYNSLNNRI